MSLRSITMHGCYQTMHCTASTNRVARALLRPPKRNGRHQMSCARLEFMAELHGRAEIEAEKQRKFHALVRHAKSNSPYYAKLIRERAIDVDNCRPADFP